MSNIEELFEYHKPRIKDLLGKIQYSQLGHAIYDLIHLPFSIHQYGFVKTLNNFIIAYPGLCGVIVFIITFLNKVKGFIKDSDNLIITYPLRMFQMLFHYLFKSSYIHNIDKYDNKRSLVVGVIPDGNRRWAKSNELSTPEGHFIGSARIIEIIRTSIVDLRIKHLIVYVLTYDNFQKRSETEQDSLLSILRHWIDEIKEYETQGHIRLNIVGEPSEKIQSVIDKIPNQSDHEYSNDNILNVSLLICYDGRREIQQAMGKPENMWIKDEVDGVIRTGGTYRASGFCTYQTGYADWFFSDEMWPDITPVKFIEYIDKIEIAKTKQNYGK